MAGVGWEACGTVFCGNDEVRELHTLSLDVLSSLAIFSLGLGVVAQCCGAFFAAVAVGGGSVVSGSALHELLRGGPF